MRKRYAAPLTILAAGALLVAAPMAPAKKKDGTKKHRVNATLIVAFGPPFPGPAPNQQTFSGTGTLSGQPFGRTGTVMSTSVLTQNADGSASGHEVFGARFPNRGSVTGFTDRLFPAQGGFLDLGGRITSGTGDFKGAKGPLTVTQIPGSTGFPQRILAGKIKY